ncbi:MAG: YncE family protein [Vulcanimicrobiaceae bacterium]
MIDRFLRIRDGRRLTVIDGVVAAALVAIVVVNYVLYSRFGPSGPPLPLRTIARITIPSTLFDFGPQVLDPRRGRLFIADNDDETIFAVDLATRRVIGDLGPTSAINAIAVDSELDRIFASRDDKGSVGVFDESSLRPIGSVKTGNVVALLADQLDRRIYAARESGDLVAIAPANLTIGSPVALGGMPGGMTLDPLSGRILVSLNDPSQLVSVDPASGAVVARTILSGCRGAGSVAFDPAWKIAYVACTRSPSLIAVDTNAHRIVGRDGIPYENRSLTLDERSRRLYAVGSGGMLAIFDVRAGTIVRMAQDSVDQPSGDVTVDPATNLLYLAVSHTPRRATLLIDEQTPPRR